MKSDGVKVGGTIYTVVAGGIMEGTIVDIGKLFSPYGDAYAYYELYLKSNSNISLRKREYSLNDYEPTKKEAVHKKIRSLNMSIVYLNKEKEAYKKLLNVGAME